MPYNTILYTVSIYPSTHPATPILCYITLAHFVNTLFGPGRGDWLQTQRVNPDMWGRGSGCTWLFWVLYWLVTVLCYPSSTPLSCRLFLNHRLPFLGVFKLLLCFLYFTSLLFMHLLLFMNVIKKSCSSILNIKHFSFPFL